MTCRRPSAVVRAPAKPPLAVASSAALGLLGWKRGFAPATLANRQVASRNSIDQRAGVVDRSGVQTSSTGILLGSLCALLERGGAAIGFNPRWWFEPRFVASTTRYGQWARIRIGARAR